MTTIIPLKIYKASLILLPNKMFQYQKLLKELLSNSALVLPLKMPSLLDKPSKMEISVLDKSTT